MARLCICVCVWMWFMFLWYIRVCVCVWVCASLVNTLVRCQRRPLRSWARNVILGCRGEVAMVKLCWVIKDGLRSLRQMLWGDSSPTELTRLLSVSFSPLFLCLLTCWPSVCYLLINRFYFDIFTFCLILKKLQFQKCCFLLLCTVFPRPFGCQENNIQLHWNTGRLIL